MSWKITILPALVILFLGLTYLYMNRYDYIYITKWYAYPVEMRINKITNHKCYFINYFDGMRIPYEIVDEMSFDKSIPICDE
tara:strand:+ start:285 stop:530 length:246 start_codon:yes stop_codon:yes gene_type:complete